MVVDDQQLHAWTIPSCVNAGKIAGSRRTLVLVRSANLLAAGVPVYLRPLGQEWAEHAWAGGGDAAGARAVQCAREQAPAVGLPPFEPPIHNLNTAGSAGFITKGFFRAANFPSVGDMVRCKTPQRLGWVFI
jgi:hypothetical protein